MKRLKATVWSQRRSRPSDGLVPATVSSQQSEVSVRLVVTNGDAMSGVGCAQLCLRNADQRHVAALFEQLFPARAAFISPGERGWVSVFDADLLPGAVTGAAEIGGLASPLCGAGSWPGLAFYWYGRTDFCYWAFDQRGAVACSWDPPADTNRAARSQRFATLRQLFSLAISDDDLAPLLTTLEATASDAEGPVPVEGVLSAEAFATLCKCLGIWQGNYEGLFRAADEMGFATLDGLAELCHVGGPDPRAFPVSL